MPTTTTVLDGARDLIRKRLAELAEERKRLERALGELGHKARPTRRGSGPGRPGGSSSTKKLRGNAGAVKVAAAIRRRP